MSRGKYQCYPLEVKTAIIASQNPNLFPHLSIPKSTAQHWIRNGIRAQQPETTLPKVPQIDIRVQLLALIIKCLGDEVNLSRLSDCEIERLRMGIFSSDGLVRGHLGGGLRDRLRRVLSPCKRSIDGRCLRRFSSQLTAMEVETMKRLVTSSRYGHMSISSLSLLAVREDLLFCSHHTWYKYIARHKWPRPHAKRKKALRARGLSAKEPHEIWHIDISHVVTTTGEKFYLQVVLDNFSRFVIAWSLRDQISAAGTERLIKRARRAVVIAKEGSLLIADGGPENIAKRVTATIERLEPKLVRKIARKEIKNGNTMVEIFFKMLKNNHLYHAMPKNRRDLAREISFYVQQHNHVVPMRALSGCTPAESLNSSGFNTSTEIITKKNSERRALRVEENRAGICQICL